MTRELRSLYSRLLTGVKGSRRPVFALALLLTALAARGNQPAVTPPASVPSRLEPELQSLLTPARPIVGRYEVSSTPAPIERVAPADWVVHQADPVDAFGAAGPYDPWKLKRFFGGNRARVARGWQFDDGSVSAFTLLSPYPDPDFRSMHAGTLIIRFIVRR